MVADGGNDRFGDLPDELLRHVLSFLPPEDALQTCVLDTRWRDLWRRTTSLLLVFDKSSFMCSERFKNLVKLFINLRGNSSLNKCEISVSPEDETNCTHTNAKPLIEYSLACQLNELLVRKVGSSVTAIHKLTFDVVLISQHLKTLDLVLVNLEQSALNFSGCTVLEVLKMRACRIHARRMSSKSLKHLWINDLCYLPEEFHVRIYALGLISLQLDGFVGLSPFLENMPFLITAYVELGWLCSDILFYLDTPCDYDPGVCDQPYCGCLSYPVGEGVLLNGLSNVVNLELIGSPGTFTYTWDLEWRPIFCKLKTLLLNDWFRFIDLVCILQHSPILEMLTLQLDNAKKLVCTTGAQETIEQSSVCAHIKVVNIECRMVNECIHKVSKILTTCGVLPDKISINDGCSPPLKNSISGSDFRKTRRCSPLKVPVMSAWL